MRIAICDDECDYAQSILAMITERFEGERARCDIFASGADLLAAVRGNAHFDVILLDILMPGINGMEAARILRENESMAKIIFLTSTSEYAAESYAVGAYYYLLKPVDRSELWRLLQKIIEAAEARPKRLTIKTQAGYMNLELDKIEYVEIAGRTLRWGLSGGEVAEGAGRMIDIEGELLKHPSFIKPHRSYIVNMANIEVLNSNNLKTHSFRPIPISRNVYQQIKDAYISYSFSQGG